MDDYTSVPKPVLDAPSTPATPTEKSRSRFDQYYEQSPSQSPMIQITEEDRPEDSLSHSDLFPPSSARTNKRNSTHFSTPMLYSLENNSSSSLLIPGGNIPGNRSSTTSLKYVPPMAPMRNKSPSRYRSPTRDGSPKRYRSPSPKKPFNFKSTNLAAPTASSMRPSHRKGHRYKHSSVSMNLFQEPKQRAPLKVPVSFPIPTAKEFFGSCTPDQKRKFAWSCLHLALSSVILTIGFSYSLHTFSTLSHLIFYDALGCTTVVLSDIMRNFDVYTQSSIMFPFGLGRIKVLFEFALSVSLVFVGCDLISHFAEEFIISFFEGDVDVETGGHSHHGSESSPHMNMMVYELCVAATLLTTFISSRLHGDSGSASSRIGKLKHTIMSNPTHFITLIFASYLAFHPLLLSLDSDIEFNEVSSLAISVLIIYMGWKVVKRLGYTILLSAPGLTSNKSVTNELKQRIIDLDEFKKGYEIKNLVVSQVHLELVIVLANIRMIGGTDDDELNVRYKISEVVGQVIDTRHRGVETTIDIDRI